MSLALEIVWFRMLVTLLRPTAYAFTIMLAAVLSGIALGSAIAAPLLARGRPWLQILTVVQLLISIASVLSLNALGSLDTVARRLGPVLAGVGLDPYVVPIVIASLVAMLPTTLLLGFAFPVGLSLWAGASTDSSRRIGVFYSLNVCGAIAGSILGGFILLPMLGSRGSLIATAALALLSSVLLALSQWRMRPNFAGFMAIVGPIAFAMAALNAVDPFSIASHGSIRRARDVARGGRSDNRRRSRGRRRGRAPTGSCYLDGMHQASDYTPDGLRPPSHRRHAGAAASASAKARSSSDWAAEQRPGPSHATPG